MKCKQCQREIDNGSIYCNWCGKKQLSDKQLGEIPVPRARQLASGNWVIHLRIKGHSVTVTESSEELCRAKARAIKVGLIKEKSQPCQLLLTEAIDNYIEGRKNIVSPATIRSYRKIQRIRFTGLMNCKISDITQSKLQLAVNNEIYSGKDGQALSAKTIKDAYCFIKTVLVDNDTDIDFKRITLPRIQPSPFKTLTSDEISRLLSAIVGNPCEIQILLALWLGLRRSEIIALKKSDFDFKRKTVTISSALVQDENNIYVEKGTKCAASARILSCPDYILDKVSKLPEGKLFKMNANYILKCLHRVCEENNLPQVRLHDLRHINASVMLMLNIPDKYAMERGGWSSKDTMTGRYQHTYDAMKTSVDNKINNYFNDLIL